MHVRTGSVRTVAGLALAVISLLYGCGDGSTPTDLRPGPDPTVTTVLVRADANELTALGQTTRVTADVRDQNGTPMPSVTVTWSSTHPAVASVDGGGLVTAVAPGTAAIRAQASGVQGETTISVTQIVSAVTVQPAEAHFTALGDTTRLAASARDANGHTVEGASFTWSSGDPSIVAVDPSGLATSVAPGEAVVRAESGDVQGVAAVTVAPEVADVALEGGPLRLEALQDTARLTARAVDANGHPIGGILFAWSSSDPTVATVDATGLVTAAANGVAVVSAADERGRGAQATVTVAQAPAGLGVRMAPATAAAGQAFDVDPEVEVRDANGFRVTSDGPRTVAAALTLASAPVSSSGSATLAGTLSVTADAGLARFTDLRLDGVVGTYVLQFASVGLVPARTGLLALGPGPAAALETLEGQDTDVIAGGDVEPHVRVTDAFGNAVPGGIVEWRVLAGSGAVDPATSSSGPEGVASTVWTTGTVPGVENRLEAALGGGAVATVISTVPVSAVPPFTFEQDTDWLDPARPARVAVLDGEGRRIPTANLTLRIDAYGCCGSAAQLVPAGDGTATLDRTLDRPATTFRVRATHGGTAVEGLMLIITHDRVDERQVVATEHWRMVLPVRWVKWMSTGVSDWERALDVGWEGQKQLMGMTGEEAHNDAQPGNPLLPHSTALEDRNVCGTSSIPLSFGQDCFTFPGGPWDRNPRWFIIFHEMGHVSTIAQQGRAVFCQLLCAPDGGATWIEGDASLFSFWSSHRMMNDLSLGAAARESVRANVELDMEAMESQLQEWEASSAAFSDSNDFAGFHAGAWDGIHGRTIDEFGWEWIPRYARAFRSDAVVCRLMRDSDSCFVPGNATLAKRATFVAAAVSAAVRTDLRQQFLDLRFPLDEDLFQQLYDHLVTAMDAPW